MITRRCIRIPIAWGFPLAVLGGIIAGLGLLTIYISNAFSYLSDKPKTCVNCHVMVPSYATWTHSSHREQAVCNDCHVPQYNPVAKYSFKAKDGLFHSAVFTAQAEPQAIIIRSMGRQAVNDNCVRCHQALLSHISITATALLHADDACWRCHRYTPHGRRRSLSVTPYAFAPTLGSQLPFRDAPQKKIKRGSHD